jgi:hypothetical protein
VAGALAGLALPDRPRPRTVGTLTAGVALTAGGGGRWRVGCGCTGRNPVVGVDERDDGQPRCPRPRADRVRSGRGTGVVVAAGDGHGRSFGGVRVQEHGARGSRGGGGRPERAVKMPGHPCPAGTFGSSLHKWNRAHRPGTGDAHRGPPSAAAPRRTHNRILPSAGAVPAAGTHGSGPALSANVSRRGGLPYPGRRRGRVGAGARDGQHPRPGAHGRRRRCRPPPAAATPNPVTRF